MVRSAGCPRALGLRSRAGIVLTLMVGDANATLISLAPQVCGTVDRG